MGATGTHGADLQRQSALQRLHLRHPRGVGRRGRTPAAGPSEARRRGAGWGRGGDEVAAVAAVAPRPGPAVQPGSRRSRSSARGVDSLSWQPRGAGPEERPDGDAREPPLLAERLGAGLGERLRRGHARRRGFRRSGVGRGCSVTSKDGRTAGQRRE